MKLRNKKTGDIYKIDELVDHVNELEKEVKNE